MYQKNTNPVIKCFFLAFSISSMSFSKQILGIIFTMGVGDRYRGHNINCVQNNQEIVKEITNKVKFSKKM